MLERPKQMSSWCCQSSTTKVIFTRTVTVLPFNGTLISVFFSSADLSLQIQALVTVNGEAGGDSFSMDIVSQQLVTFQSVSELQEKNAELLKIVRRLTFGRELGSSEDIGSLSALESANCELAILRESRIRTEDLVRHNIPFDFLLYNLKGLLK